MNIQSWKIPFAGSQSIEQQLSIALPQNKFFENAFFKSQNLQTQKSVTISNFFECSEKVKFIVAIAKFATIFNVEIDSLDCLKLLSQKQRDYIRDYNFESVLADTNRKQFAKFFQKSVDPAVTLLATFEKISAIVLIIQNSYDQAQKPKVKILNYENLIHSILNNVKLQEGYQHLDKFLSQKYKKISRIICYQKCSAKAVNNQLLSYLLSKFEQVCYIAMSHDQDIQLQQFVEHNFKFQNKLLNCRSNDKAIIMTTNRISNQSRSNLCQFYNQYRKINMLINNQINISKISLTMFKQNQICMAFYGIYYNLISVYQLFKEENIKLLQQSFLSVLINQKISHQQKLIKQQKKNQNRKLGHYPVRIQKGSKVCCVCQDNKKKKSRFKCQKCTDTFSRDIAICIEHFRKFHQNIHKYIPKGVRKGAYKNQLMQFNEVVNKQIQQEQNPVQNSHKEGHNQQPYAILNKWSGKHETSENIMAQFSQIYKYTTFANPLFYPINLVLQNAPYIDTNEKVKSVQAPKSSSKEKVKIAKQKKKTWPM